MSIWNGPSPTDSPSYHINPTDQNGDERAFMRQQLRPHLDECTSMVFGLRLEEERGWPSGDDSEALIYWEAELIEQQRKLWLAGGAQ